MWPFCWPAAGPQTRCPNVIVRRGLVNRAQVSVRRTSSIYHDAHRATIHLSKFLRDITVRVIGQQDGRHATMLTIAQNAMCPAIAYHDPVGQAALLR